MAGFLFIRKGAAEKLVLTPNATSYLLLALEPGADGAAAEERLRRRLRDDADLLPAAVVKQNDVRLLAKVFAVPLRLMVTIAFAVGTAILGMVIYSATVERMREYGVLKAVGARNRHLYWLVTQQGMATAVLGVGLGIALAALAAQGIMRSAPKFLIVLEPRAVLVTVASGLLMGVLAALLPARRAATLDPAQVFRK
jgi:putative ABC transport system permease protein